MLREHRPESPRAAPTIGGFERMMGQGFILYDQEGFSAIRALSCAIHAYGWRVRVNDVLLKCGSCFISCCFCESLARRCLWIKSTIEKGSLHAQFPLRSMPSRPTQGRAHLHHGGSVPAHRAAKLSKRAQIPIPGLVQDSGVPLGYGHHTPNFSWHGESQACGMPTATRARSPTTKPGAYCPRKPQDTPQAIQRKAETQLTAGSG